MSRIYVEGAGGAPSNNIIRSLKESGGGYNLLEISLHTDFVFADVEENHLRAFE